MCGIAGFSLNPKDKIDPGQLAEALSLGIVDRGHDATGVAFVKPDDTGIIVRKAPVPAGRFAQMGGFAGMEGVLTAVIHTRLATQGAPADPGNNHPIRRGNIVGVHNGMLWNDNEIFGSEDMPRDAEVDSEAIFALLQKYPDLEPGVVLQSVEGSAAIAWLDANGIGDLHLARLSSSPLAVAQTRSGSLFFASEMKYLDGGRIGVATAWSDVVRHHTHMVAHGGRINVWEPIPQPEPVKRSTGRRAGDTAPIHLGNAPEVGVHGEVVVTNRR